MTPEAVAYYWEGVWRGAVFGFGAGVLFLSLYLDKRRSK